MYSTGHHTCLVKAGICIVTWDHIKEYNMQIYSQQNHRTLMSLKPIVIDNSVG